MKLSREFAVAAPPVEVSEYSKDIPSVAACLPGAERKEAARGHSALIGVGDPVSMGGMSPVIPPMMNLGG